MLSIAMMGDVLSYGKMNVLYGGWKSVKLIGKNGVFRHLKESLHLPRWKRKGDVLSYYIRGVFSLS